MAEQTRETEKINRGSPLELSGSTALITGSSSGIGRAIALELAAAGADVIVHARSSREAAQAVAREINSLGRQSRTEFRDLADAATHEPLVELAWQWHGGIDVWVNNAGADVLTGEAGRASFEEKLEQLWQVDVVATMRLARMVGQRMKQRGRGVILNIGWDQAEHGMKGDSGEMFAAIKGAVMAFSRSLAQSLAPEVRVNCIAPGWIKTSWGEHATEYWQQRATNESLRNRWGTPEDVGRIARFLASPAADFINGQVIAANGGFRYETGGPTRD